MALFDWTTLVVLVGSLGALGLASFFVPALGNFVAQAFASLFSAIRQIVQFIIDMLPKPFKILLFIGLFVSLGLVAYNFTYGAQFVCAAGQVEKVGWLQGLTYKLTSAPDNVFQENQQVSDLDALNTTTPLVATNVMQENGSNIIQSQKGTWKGIQYNISFVLMPRDEIRRLGFGLIGFFEANDGDIWSKWYSGDSHIEYDLCYDPFTKTCTLARYVIKNTNPADFIQIASGGCLSTPVWQQTLGSIAYYADSNSMSLTGSYGESSRGILDLFTGGTSGLTSQCKAITDTQLANEEASTFSVSTVTSAYNSILKGQTPKQVTLISTSWTGVKSTYSIPIYDVDYNAIHKEALNNTVFSTASQTLGPAGQITDTRMCTGDKNTNCDKRTLLTGATLVKSSPTDIVTVSCNTKSGNPEDTTVKIAGIDVLDPTNMIMFVLIGSLFSAIIWLKQLRK